MGVQIVVENPDALDKIRDRYELKFTKSFICSKKLNFCIDFTMIKLCKIKQNKTHFDLFNTFHEQDTVSKGQMS